jgi:hypothetical protein
MNLYHSLMSNHSFRFDPKNKMTLAKFLDCSNVPKKTTIRQQMGLSSKSHPELPLIIEVDKFPYLTGVPPPTHSVMGAWMQPLIINDTRFPAPVTVRAPGNKRKSRGVRNSKDIDLVSMLSSDDKRMDMPVDRYESDDDFSEHYPDDQYVTSEVDAWDSL